MKHLRAFLFAKNALGEWSATTFREMAPLLDAIATSLKFGSSAVHLGFWRPDTSAVVAILDRWPNSVLMSESATGAFPSSIAVKVSAESIAECEGLRFHLALEGFGYSRADHPPQPFRLSEMELPRDLPVRAPSAAKPRGWVASVIDANPGLDEQLRSAGIWDDDSYLANETNLSNALRAQLGLARFHTIAGQAPNNDNIIPTLSACPPWFLALPLARLGMTVRQAHVMSAHGLEIVGHLAPFGLNGLLKLPNLGRGSVHGLSTLLYYALISEQGLPAINKMPPKLSVVSDESPPVRSPLSIAAPTPAPPLHAESLISGFIEADRKLTENRQAIWRARIGLNGEPQTLQQIGDKIGLTRERVRQIEQKAYRQVSGNPFWLELEARLEMLLKDRSSPLLLAGVQALDPWFEGAATMVNPLREVFKHVMAKTFGIFELSGALIVTGITQAEWNEAVSSARKMLEAHIPDQLSEAHARALVYGLLVGRGEELRDELWSSVSDGALWVDSPGQQRVLSGFTDSADEFVLAILRSSPTPLKVAEVHRRIVAMGYNDHDEGYIRNTCHSVAFLYGRSTYGLRSHCPISEGQLALVRAECEDLIGGSDSSRQWHTAELFDAMLERGLDFDGLLTVYIINIALRASANLIYLRRMVWRQKVGGSSLNPSARLDVRQAVIALLESAGRPLTTADIRDRLAKERGLATHFQIHPEPPLIRIGTGTWGLIGRDADLASSQHLLDLLATKLEELQRGIHISELAVVLDSPELQAQDAAQTMLALAKPSGIRVDRGQYAYLEQWKVSRRISILDAVIQSIYEKQPQGASLDYISARTEELTMRPIPRFTLRQVLQHCDAEWDEATSLWHRGNSAELTPDEDEIEGTLP